MNLLFSLTIPPNPVAEPYNNRKIAKINIIAGSSHFLPQRTQRIQRIKSGELYMKKDVRKKASQLILIILGSGIIRSNLKKLE